MTQESIKPEFKLWQTVFTVRDEAVKTCKVIAVYNLKKVKQDRDNYFFDATSQLIAEVEMLRNNGSKKKLGN